MPSLNWIFVLVCLLQVKDLCQAQQVEGCPQYCSCARTINGVSANCNYQRLTSMQGMVFPPDTFYLDFSFNTLSEINRSAIPNLPNLMTLKIEECQVSSIDADSFAHLPHLQNLTLSGNLIQDIHKDAFRGLHNLRHLFLEKNKIMRLDDGVFDSLQLEQLFLTQNNIQQLTSGTFNGLVVGDLRLGGNKLSRLTSEMFQTIKPRLKILKLDSNEVPLEIDINTFESMLLHVLNLRNSSLADHGFLKHVTAQTLDLSANPFNNLDFSAYTGLNRVQELNLANVGIEFLDEKTLSPFRSLSVLDLSENKMSVVSGSVWQKVPNLQQLDLSANPIAQLSNSFGRYLTSLTILVLRGGKLTELMNPEPFMPMVNLQKLDVGGNNIQVIGQRMQPILNRLQTFIVDSNKFHCNCEILWLYDWIIQSNQEMKYVVRGFDLCSSPGQETYYIWGQPREEMACHPPTITHIIGSSELGPHASGNEQVLEVAPGSTIMLQCSAQADPAPSIQWVFPFATADEVVIEPNTNRSVLRTSSHYQLKDIRFHQSGQYKCVASNVQGTAEGYIQINVREDMTLPYTPGPPIPFTTTTTAAPSASETRPTKPTSPKPNDNIENPTLGNQVKADDGGSDDKVKYTVIGVGVGVVIITLIVLIVVIVYVYKARQRAYQRTYDVRARVEEGAKNPGMDGMTNGEMANGHTQLSRLDSQASTTPFGLSDA